MEEKTLEELKNEIAKTKNEDSVNVEIVNILFLDISSTCTGYTVAEIDFNKKTGKIKSVGALWLDNSWTHQEKYLYMYKAISNYFWIVEQIDYIVVEAYMINPNKLMGVSVVSEMQGTIKCAAWENGVKVDSIMVQSWRKLLNIKPNTKNGKRDWKEPAKQKALEYFNIPEQILSNMSSTLRKTPTDAYDAACICLAWLNKFNLKIITNSVEFNTHIGQYLKGE